MNKTKDERSVTFSCLKIRQPIGEFFIAVIRSDILCDIAKFYVRRVLQDERDIERYLGIQRPLKGKRVNDLEKYVRYFDATFPTSIIISVEAECAYYDENSNTMTLSNINRETLSDSVPFEGIARVLDGQHRIAGLFGYDGHEFYLTVTIFVGIDIADQAQIFSTVNLEQTKVNKSLAYDLFALATSRSPQKNLPQRSRSVGSRSYKSIPQKYQTLGSGDRGEIYGNDYSSDLRRIPTEIYV